MFIGHPQFAAFASIPGFGSPWLAVEIAPMMPWFIAVFFNKEDNLYTQIAISGSNAFEIMQERKLLGQLTSLYLVSTNQAGNPVSIDTLEIIEIYWDSNYGEEDPDRFVIQSVDSRYFGGYPLRPITPDVNKLVQLHWWASFQD